MPDLHGQLTPQGNLNGTLNTIVYADNYNVLENKPSINSVTLQGNKTATDLGLATPEDITVTSVNGETGAVVLDGSDINYDADTTINNKIDDLQSQISSSGVLAVNGKTGVVILTGSDINYSAGVTLNSKIDAVESEIPTVSYPVTSVNSKTGAVVLDGSDIAYDENNTVNEKIAAVESEIPTVDYPVTSVNEQTGDVSLTAGDVPLGTDFSDPNSTAGAIAGKINPPDLANITRTALTSGTALEVTSTGKWYCVRSVNSDTVGSLYAYILDSTQTNYLSATQGAASGNYQRCTTSWLYFPSGVKFYARGGFTDSAASGLLSAPPIT